MSKQQIVDKFTLILDNECEMFFSTGDTKQDYQNITDTLKTQGYWSGSKYRYYFDKNFNLINVTERW